MGLSDIIFRFKAKAESVFGEDAFDWADRSYIIDWIVVGVLMVLASAIERFQVYERDFSPDDPTISHKKTKQQISGSTNAMIAIAVPLVVVGLSGVFRRSLGEIHHGFLATFAGRGLSDLVTEGLKNRVGRLRPDFLSRCKWDAVAAACTGKHDQVNDGRRSFPSGHSSTAWVGMTTVSLFLAGKTAAWCFNTPAPARSIIGSRMSRLVITFLPLSFAIWVAVSRVEDYRHHKEDVIVGSFIGASSSLLIYLMYWPNPFSASSFAPGVMGRPRAVYGTYARSREIGGYELSSMEPDSV
ncbi:lipid phosphate phosphatase 1 [Stereum hirsutum FP-91666 SS1]|uniref:lipid phosphate phosphatase 1 n=1 Tax=Stereum hirsutum (strain FP-91666) TaxID=721885 RepID=UPI000440D059|nr:lipid phosphate phosphatase 1 [Stereum hirsutum FP-91666 SS1]EIM86809.1 lipid phosphate phosphatase 1 [Stereum hirsutum FP-91666 SS1]